MRAKNVFHLRQGSTVRVTATMASSQWPHPVFGGAILLRRYRADFFCVTTLEHLKKYIRIHFFSNFFLSGVFANLRRPSESFQPTAYPTTTDSSR